MISNINIADSYFKNDAIQILNNGYLDENPRPKYSDGIPAHTRSINQVYRKYDLSKNQFPFMTLRPQPWKSAIKEILWIYQDASNDLEVLRSKYNVQYWDEWDVGDGTIGSRYGETIKRHYNIGEFINDLKSNPFGRRHIIDLWQVDDFKEPGLNPCAFLTMWNVRKTKTTYYIDMTLVQRSGDMCAASGAGGINEIQYCALMMMICKSTGYEPGIFVHFVQNEQIYDRHYDNVRIMLSRPSLGQPILKLDTKNTDFYKFTIDDFKLVFDHNIAKENPQLQFDLGI